MLDDEVFSESSSKPFCFLINLRVAFLETVTIKPINKNSVVIKLKRMGHDIGKSLPVMMARKIASP